ncbi:ribosomal protein S18-alanine N-acetyltransferase [Lachnospiraceae bacterium OttesenSCG-928-E19]|nr:ribosomal protein S18-alanine N-acetyltransferase [Lachnospiraceae bacterium OttesenSCG-928-E19]
MKENDSKEIADVEKKVFSDAWSEKGILETFRQPNAIILVAQKNDRIQGYFILYHILNEGEILRIAVCDEARGKGIGSQLILEAEKRCKKLGVEKLLLDVRESNEIARKFYKRHGFVEDGIRRDFYRKPTEDAVLMSKEIKEEV